jgi:hypothetical protein
MWKVPVLIRPPQRTGKKRRHFPKLCPIWDKVWELMASERSGLFGGGVGAALGLAEAVKEESVISDGFLDELLEQE